MQNLKNRLIWTAATAGALGLFFILCRYAFFSFHGMKQWPFILFIFGLIIIAVSAIINCRKLMVFTSAGYMAGFIIGMLFNTNGLDPGGGSTSNGWLIWEVTFLIIIMTGMLLEIIISRVKGRKGKV